MNDRKKEIKYPKTIILRLCPKCFGRQSWNVHGFAYPAGDSSKWKCWECNYSGKPKYLKFNIKLEESK